MSHAPMSLQRFNQMAGSFARDFAEANIDRSQLHSWLIAKMNRMYELPIQDQPSLFNLGKDTFLSRMDGFMKTLQKEMDEGKMIQVAMELYAQLVDSSLKELNEELIIGRLTQRGVEDKLAKKFAVDMMAYYNRDHGGSIASVEQGHIPANPRLINIEKFILVSLADWFADMTVFDFSESMKYGIPMQAVFQLVMASNFTKLGEDGLPIKDDNGKVLKGPNFIAPEDHIEAFLFERESLQGQATMRWQEHTAMDAVVQPLLDEEVAPEEDEEGDDEDYLVDEDPEDHEEE